MITLTSLSVILTYHRGTLQKTSNTFHYIHVTIDLLFYQKNNKIIKITRDHIHWFKQALSRLMRTKLYSSKVANTTNYMRETKNCALKLTIFY